SAHLIKGLQAISGVTVHGITDPGQFDKRVPTVTFTREGFAPADIARRLAAENIFVWDGDYYAVEVVKHLGLAESGGMVRVGPVHYNTIAELDRLLAVLEEM
ncbi:MAG: aminotransferase class V-fold PLP-dependent enzyme, partial [Calditrichaeota bacterium]|nr:aminotransferase class V-fold PLP-dependent enzyme [Calditrichota bacterium]